MKKYVDFFIWVLLPVSLFVCVTTTQNLIENNPYGYLLSSISWIAIIFPIYYWILKKSQKKEKKYPDKFPKLKIILGIFLIFSGVFLWKFIWVPDYLLSGISLISLIIVFLIIQGKKEQIIKSIKRVRDTLDEMGPFCNIAIGILIGVLLFFFLNK